VARGTPLGLTSDLHVGHATLPRVAGSRIFMFTDGLYEFAVQGRAGVPGIRTMKAALADTAGMSIDAAVKRIVETVDRLRPEETPQEDDMTFVLIDVLSA
jgi:serine phosphatase RsbU (regulator of sigma subunit)